MHDKVVDVATTLEGMYELPRWKKLRKLEERAAGFADRVAIEMRIARGGPGLSVIQQPTNDWQALAERQRPHGELWRMSLMRASSPSGLCAAMSKKSVRSTVGGLDPSPKTLSTRQKDSG